MAVLVFMVALVLLSFATLPAWPYSNRWGYYPAGACGLAVVVMAASVLAGRF
jgi:hypothetical protein